MGAQDRIKELMFAANRPLSGAQIGFICHVGSWRLYPILHGLERDDVVESDWELEIIPGAPRRRLYRLSRWTGCNQPNAAE